MPSHHHEESVIGALAWLIASRDSDMIKWCTRTAQSQLKLVAELVENMQKGVEPRIHTLAPSGFLKKNRGDYPVVLNVERTRGTQVQGLARCFSNAA